MTLKLRHDSSGYLTCEHVSVFYLLMLNSGIMGAYTYVVRGGVFCTDGKLFDAGNFTWRGQL